jgi:hypothetical protein
MIYYTFNTQEEALVTEKHIVDNIKNWVSVNSPESLTENGEALKGRNAKTGDLVESAITNRWAIPEKTIDNKWVFLKPTQDKVSSIPIEIVLNNINASEQEFDPNWFSFNIE